MILVDTNVLIDIADDDPVWGDWSAGKLADAAGDGASAFNQVVIAEFGPRFVSLAALFAFGDSVGAAYVGFDEAAAFAAGKAFIAYQRKRGADAARIPLPDFFIGGHAQVVGAAILTRDPRFYRNYFPDVPLITPETTS
jgi:predicted nucleic acid-binding protein